MGALKKYFLFVILFSIFLIYVHNLSRGTYGGDVGDLITASYVFGVPHPPGYPLFTFWGFVFSRLPFQATPAFKIGLVSILASILSLYFYYRYSLKSTKNYLIAILAMLILAFSYLFWFYSEIVEVFTLNIFFAILILYLAMLFYETKKLTHYYLLVFFSALSLTNHHTIIFIFPSIFLLIFSRLRLLQNPKIILYTLFLIALGLLPYLYIPFAAFKNPVINWGKASTLENFLHLVLRRDYGTFNAGPFAIATPLERLLLLKNYGIFLVSSISLPAFILCFLGMVKLLREDKKIFLSLFLALFLTGPVFLAYAGYPLVSGFTIGMTERFFLLSSVILLFFLPFGLSSLNNFFKLVFSKKIYAILLMLTFFIIPVLLFKYNFPKTDLSKTVIGDNLGYDFLSTLPKGAIFFSGGDTSLFNTWYVHYVLGFRRDTYLGQIGGLNDSDYINSERKIFERESKNLKGDKEKLLKFLLYLKEKKSIYSINKIELDEKDIIWLPKGLIYELKFKNEIPSKEEYLKDVEKIWENLHVPKRSGLTLAERNLTISDISTAYSDSLIKTGNFLFDYYRATESALNYYQKAVQVDDQNPKAYAALGNLQLNSFKNCQAAKNNFKKAVFYNPAQKLYYLFLYLIYKDCSKNEDQVKLIKNKFYAVFGKTIESEIKELSKENSDINQNEKEN